VDSAKGWRTIGFNALVALAGVIVATKWGDVLPPQYTLLVTTIVVPMVNGWLRSVSDGPVGWKPTPDEDRG